MPLTESVRRTLKDLLKLKEVDQNLQRIRKRCTECPSLIEKHKRDYENEGYLVEEKTKAITDLKVEMHQKEVDLKTCEEKVTKLSAQLLEASTNQEYSAFQDQIKRINDEKGEYETQILETMDCIESIDTELREAQSEHSIRETEFKDLKSSLETDLTQYQAEAVELEKKRNNLIYNFDPEALRSYERVVNALGSDGIVPIENRNCSGCYMAITSNDYVKICAMKEIVLCKSCQRLLYSPEFLDRESAE